MIDLQHSLFLIGVMEIVTIFLRFLPFVLFSKNTPKPILYLGKVLPPAMMGMLVVYCLRNTQIFGSSHGIPEALSVLVVVGLHKWRHNTLFSIFGGTLCYMILVQAF